MRKGGGGWRVEATSLGNHLRSNSLVSLPSFAIEKVASGLISMSCY